MKALFVFVVFLFFPVTAFATAPSILGPSSINLDSSFSINATMSGLSSNTIYRLRIVLAPIGTSNYFGSTNNGSIFYNGTPSPIDYSKFLSITTDQNGTWYGDVQGKIESTDPNYSNIGNSNYDLKVGRYTQSGSTATWSNILAVSLVAPSLTPTPIPSLTSTIIPTKTPTPTISPTNTPTITKAISKTPTPQENKDQTTKEVLAESISKTNDTSNRVVNKSNENNSSQSFNLIAVIFISIGIVFLLACVIVILYPIIKARMLNKNE